MKVRATAITQSLVEGLNLSPEELIIYEARVSNPENQGNVETSDKLLKFLIDNKHWSPFDMVNLTVEVTTSKAIAIQILRHWTINIQEFSQRYSTVDEMESIEIRRIAKTNRQSSEEVFDPIIVAGGVEAKASWHIKAVTDLVRETYQALIKADVAKESARMILPMATTTTMYLNGTVRSWIFYLQQRTSQHAQKEHRLVAAEIEKVFKQYFPNVAKALGI